MWWHLRHATRLTHLTRIATSPITSHIRLLSAMPTITVTPLHGLVDSDLTITVDGLEAARPYTLYLSLVESGHKFISCGHYVADNRGAVDCVRDACLGGTYDGRERHGLIWSMVQAPGQRVGLRLLKRDASLPYNVDLSLLEGHQDLETCHDTNDSTSIAKTTFQRTYMGEGVRRQPIREGRLRGTLFVPAGPGPFPAVIDLFGGAGGVVEFRAALLASHGIMSLHLAYFAYEDLPKNLKLIDLDYFEEGVDFLNKHPLTKGNVGIVGVSKGAEIAFNMAANFPPHKLGAVVGINGFNYVYATPTVYKGTYQEVSVGLMSKVYFTDSGAMAFDEAIRHYRPKEGSIFKLENAEAEFLLISSVDDLQIPPECSHRIVERLERFGKKNYEHMAFGKGVGHLIEPCHAPSFDESYQANLKCQLAWGGEKKPHARAQETAWARILSFLKEKLGHNGSPNLKNKL